MFQEARETFFTSLNGQATGTDKGWGFHTGDPEFWRFRERLYVPNGKALDLGSGPLRGSLCLALWGMDLVAYDLNREDIEIANLYPEVVKQLDSDFSLKIDARVGDINRLSLGREKYDTVVLGQTFIHYKNKSTAYRVLNKALDALKPDGHLYLRAVTKADGIYEDHLKGWSTGFRVNKDVWEDGCACTGEYRYEPFLFFDHTELPIFLATKGLTLVHTQIAPQFGKTNVMFGENWHSPASRDKINGMITLIAQK